MCTNCTTDNKYEKTIHKTGGRNKTQNLSKM